MTDPTCNLCGLTCVLRNETAYKSVGGLINKTVYGNYDSTAGNGYGALDDMTSYTFSLCEWCLDWLFQQFKIPVKVLYPAMTNDELLNDIQDAPTTEIFKPALERVLGEEQWRTHKEAFSKEFLLRNNARMEALSDYFYDR